MKNKFFDQQPKTSFTGKEHVFVGDLAEFSLEALLNLQGTEKDIYFLLMGKGRSKCYAFVGLDNF